AGGPWRRSRAFTRNCEAEHSLFIVGGEWNGGDDDGGNGWHDLTSVSSNFPIAEMGHPQAIQRPSGGHNEALLRRSRSSQTEPQAQTGANVIMSIVAAIDVGLFLRWHVPPLRSVVAGGLNGAHITQVVLVMIPACPLPQLWLPPPSPPPSPAILS
ncbi:hypothetical protein HaLaN_18785, partial [Haematococcus lacustris]